jgi:hypothetical protein
MPCSFPKFGVPNPVTCREARKINDYNLLKMQNYELTGSHPAVAVKPYNTIRIAYHFKQGNGFSQ